MAAVKDADVLSTVALVLAVVAFVAQLLIFIAQAILGSHQNEQIERVNSQTSSMLGELDSRLRRLDDVQSQQFREIRETLLPAAIGHEWVERIDAVTEDVASESSSPAEIQKALEELRADIYRASDGQRRYTKELIACPSCGRSITVMLGDQIGDTAQVSCDICGARTNAHRRESGVALRPLGASSSEPGAILKRNRMVLPSPQERLDILAQIRSYWRAGDLGTARDITTWMSAGSEIRNPLFFALINPDYGTIKLEENPGLKLTYWRVGPIDELDDSEWLKISEAGWLAQALYRLRAWQRNPEDLSRFMFPDGDERAKEIIELATEFEQRVRLRESRDEAAAQLSQQDVHETVPDAS